MTKEKTLKSYNLTAEAYAQNVDALHPVEAGKFFVALLPPKGQILDIGCGPGRDARIFSEQGFKVTGVDFSPEMIRIAQENVPFAHFEVMDIESLSFAGQTFDGVWANASLLHIAKNQLPSVLHQIHRLLNCNGIFYLSVKQGNGEILESDKRYGGHEKFWSYYDSQELALYLEQAGFTIIESWTKNAKVSYETHPLLQMFCKKESL